MSNYPKIIFVPLDSRPCNADWPKSILHGVGFDLISPPKEMLGSYAEPGSPESIYDYIASELAAGNILNISADMMVYGGLIPSRRDLLEIDLALVRIGKLFDLKTRLPNNPFYLFSTLLRSLPEVAAQVRSRNLDIAHTLVEMAKLSDLDLLVFSKDDNLPNGPQKAESMALLDLARALVLGERLKIVNGADELNICFIAKTLSAFYKIKPRIFVLAPVEKLRMVLPYEDEPLSEIIRSHIDLCGGQIAKTKEEADIILAVNPPDRSAVDLHKDDFNFSGHASNTALIDEIKGMLNEGKPVTLADVSFVNGGDYNLTKQIAELVQSDKFIGYSGWNTAANTCGMAIAQSIIYFIGMQKCMFNAAAKQHFMLSRLIEDNIYQAKIRGILKGRLQQQKIDPAGLNSHHEEVSAQISHEIKNEVSRIGLPFHSIEVSLPWPRIFEADVKIS